VAVKEHAAVFLRDVEGGIGVVVRRAARHSVAAVPLPAKCADKLLSRPVRVIIIRVKRHRSETGSGR
jgi:hypothetical protein